MTELLKELAVNLRLDNISDLKFFDDREQICKAIMEVRETYPAKDWQEAVRYIIGKEYPIDGPVVAATLIRFHRNDL